MNALDWLRIFHNLGKLSKARVNTLCNCYEWFIFSSTAIVSLKVNIHVCYWFIPIILSYSGKLTFLPITSDLWHCNQSLRVYVMWFGRYYLFYQFMFLSTKGLNINATSTITKIRYIIFFLLGTWLALEVNWNVWSQNRSSSLEKEVWF